MTKTLLSITFLAIGLVAVVLLSCRKETDSLIEIYAESFGGDTKLMVANDTISVWEDHDRIRINGTTAEVIRNANGHAYITATAASDVNMALFPETLYDAPITSEVVSITLPAEYKYKTGAGGKQSLPVPMAAISASNSPLHFRHLTGALWLRIEDNLTLESITVISNKYQLSGSRTLRFADIEGQQPVETLDPAQRRVTMLFDAQQVTSSIDVMIPIAPVGDSNRFTIEIEARREGTRYHFRRTQNTGGALGRNILATTATTVIGNDDFTTIGKLFSGLGTDKGDPFLITCPNDLRVMVDAVNSQWTFPGNNYKYCNCYYELTDSLDMQSITINPMDGLAEGRFFNGKGYSIKNLTIQNVVESSNSFCGLFSHLQGGAEVKNLIMRNTTLIHSGSANDLYMSPICAHSGRSSVTRCTVDNVTVCLSGTMSTIHYGSMIGHIDDNITATITNCTVEGIVVMPTLSNNLHFGGIIGRIEGSGIAAINNCTVTNQTLSVTSSKPLYVGGFIGNMASGTSATISSPRLNGNIYLNSGSAVLNAGGLVGLYNTTGQFNIDGTCTISGEIAAYSTHSTNAFLGAFIGKAASPGGITTPSFPNNLTLTFNGDTCTKRIGNGN